MGDIERTVGKGAERAVATERPIRSTWHGRWARYALPILPCSSWWP